MKILLLSLPIFILTSINACSQNTVNKDINTKKHVGGPCEGCEAIYEQAPSFDNMPAVDTLPDYNEPGPKIEISGIVYQRDGKTPAKDVIIYVYHTDQAGLYSTKENQTGWAKKHGYIRGWIKTNALGQYRIFTLVPASYPKSSNPKHIHPVIKEPGKTEYWIDDFVFDDDPLLPEKERTRARPAGGSGVLKPGMKDGMLRATRNIILGLHVENYPLPKTTK